RAAGAGAPALRERRRERDREGDRAVGEGDQGLAPRRSRPARRDRRRAAVLMRVALLGTGLMGAPMGRNLVAAGHEVHAWNRTRSRAEAVTGATVCETP